VADKKKNDLNEEQILAYLQDIVGKIRSEEDPLELNVYRRLFRKAVPFTLRAYFAAYLMKQINTGRPVPRIGASDRNDRNTRGSRNSRNEGRQENRGEGRGSRQEGRASDTRNAETRLPEGRRAKQAESRREGRTADAVKAEPRPVLADDVSTTLFVSIGRNRRVYPRDLIGLIMQNVEMDREHIGEIRVLDNYSFVQVITEDAEKIIEALNEFEYRGRKLAVSYSRKRGESADGETSSGTPVSSGTELPGDDSYSGDEALSEGSALSDDDGFEGESQDDLEETGDFLSEGSPEEDPLSGGPLSGGPLSGGPLSGEQDDDPADDEKESGNI